MRMQMNLILVLWKEHMYGKNVLQIIYYAYYMCNILSSMIVSTTNILFLTLLSYSQPMLLSNKDMIAVKIALLPKIHFT